MNRYSTVLVLAGRRSPLAAPAGAAVTRSAGHDDSPRAPWLERYQEARQGPEQTERFAETYKIGAEGAIDLNQIAGDVRVTDRP